MAETAATGAESAPVQTAFFSCEPLEELLDTLTHLAHFSDRVLGVTGPAGSGKTALLGALVERLRGRGPTVLLHHSVIGEPDALVDVLLAAFSVPPLLAPVEEDLDALDFWLRDQDAVATVLVDDAQELGPEQLTALTRLGCERPGLALVLFADDSRAPFEDPELSQLATLAGVDGDGVHGLEIPALTAPQAAAYLQHRYGSGAVARLRPRLGSIHARSGGRPGALNRIFESQLAADQGHSSLLFGLPRLQLFALAAVVACLLGLLGAERLAQLFDAAAAPDVAGRAVLRQPRLSSSSGAPPAESRSTSPGTPAAGPPPATASTAEQAVAAPAPAPAPVADEPKVPAVSASPDASAAPPVAAVSVDTTFTAAAGTPEPQSTAAAAEPAAAADRATAAAPANPTGAAADAGRAAPPGRTEPAPPPPRRSGTAAVAAVAAVDGAASTATTAAADPAAAPGGDATAEASAAAVVPDTPPPTEATNAASTTDIGTGTPAGNAQTGGATPGAAGNGAAPARDPDPTPAARSAASDGYTLQLAVLSREAAARRFAAEAGARIRVRENDGRLQYIVYLGDHAERAAAERAAARWVAAGGSAPWIRRRSAVEAGTRALPGP